MANNITGERLVKGITKKTELIEIKGKQFKIINGKVVPINNLKSATFTTKLVNEYVGQPSKLYEKYKNVVVKGNDGITA